MRYVNTYQTLQTCHHCINKSVTSPMTKVPHFISYFCTAFFFTAYYFPAFFTLVVSSIVLLIKCVVCFAHVSHVLCVTSVSTLCIDAGVWFGDTEVWMQPHFSAISLSVCVYVAGGKPYRGNLRSKQLQGRDKHRQQRRALSRCSFCGRAYSRLVGLRSHLKRMHGMTTEETLRAWPDRRQICKYW